MVSLPGFKFSRRRDDAGSTVSTRDKCFEGIPSLREADWESAEHEHTRIEKRSINGNCSLQRSVGVTENESTAMQTEVWFASDYSEFTQKLLAKSFGVASVLDPHRLVLHGLRRLIVRFRRALASTLAKEY